MIARTVSLPLVLVHSMTSSVEASSFTGATDPYAPHWELHPQTYTVPRAPFSLWDMVDGNIEKDVWQSVPFSQAFGDIQGGTGCPDTEWVQNPAIGETRFKALYDDDYLYIAAVLHPSPDDNLPTIASFTERNSPIYQKDSDFEVFIDVFGSHHMYKEFEINAINTIWNLGLDKPYENGGSEHSGRIARPGEALYYDVKRQRTATRIVQGHINDVKGAALWTVEMAWSMSDLQQAIPPLPPPTKSNGRRVDDDAASSTTLPPEAVWRINFSRVELQGDVNWTWQAQHRWDAQQSRYRGYINMHLPDAWGYLVFAPPGRTTRTATSFHANAAEDGNVDDDDIEPITPWRDPYWPAKLTASTVYYAMHQYRDESGKDTNQIDALTLPSDIVEPFDVQIDLITNSEEDDWLVTVKSRIDDTVVSIRKDRLLKVLSNQQHDSNNDNTDHSFIGAKRS